MTKIEKQKRDWELLESKEFNKLLKWNFVYGIWGEKVSIKPIIKFKYGDPYTDGGFIEEHVNKFVNPDTGEVKYFKYWAIFRNEMCELNMVLELLTEREIIEYGLNKTDYLKPYHPRKPL